MAARHVNSDNKLYDHLVQIKRHLRTCRKCTSAIKADNETAMCHDMYRLMFDSIKFYDTLISLRVAARNSRKPITYPCPKLSAHGKSFELTAVPVVVVGYQDSLM